MSLTESKQIVYINSEKRITGTDSNFTIDLKLPDNNFDHVVVLQMSIPKSYYLIQQGYNSFDLKEEKKQIKITLPEGNYTRSSLKNTLEGLLNTNSPNGWIYTISYPSSVVAETGKLTFTVSGNMGNQPSFIFHDNDIYKVLGFNVDTTNNFHNDVLVSDNVINLNRETTLFVHSDIVSNNNQNDILQEVYGQDSPDYAYITYNCLNFEACSKKYTIRNDTINIYLTNEEGQTINLNGQNLLITLCFYKKESYTTLLKNIMKMELLK